MASILGDKTLRSLLQAVQMEDAKKEEVISLLPYMDAQDRVDIFWILYRLFALQANKKITLEEARILSDSTKKNEIDWGQVGQIEEKVLKEIVQGV